MALTLGAVVYPLASYGGSGSLSPDPNDMTVAVLDLSLTMQMDTVNQSDLEDRLTTASQILWDASDGKLRIRSVRFNDDCAPNQWLTDVFVTELVNPLDPQQGIVAGARSSAATPGLGYAQSNVAMRHSDWNNPAVFAHELLHYVVGLGDEYVTGGYGVCMIPNGSTIFSEQHHCIMQELGFAPVGESNTVVSSELCTRINHQTSRQTTDQGNLNGEACWVTLSRKLSSVLPGWVNPPTFVVPLDPGGFLPPTFVVEYGWPSQYLYVLDASGSMAKPVNGVSGMSRLESVHSSMLAALDLMANRTEAGGCPTEVGILTFSTTAHLPPYLSFTLVNDANVASLKASVNLGLAGGTTNLGDGMQQGQTLINAANQRHSSMVIFSDSQWNTGPDPETIAPGILADGIQIDGVQVGDALSEMNFWRRLEGRKLGAVNTRSSAGAYGAAFAGLLLESFGATLTIPGISFTTNRQAHEPTTAFECDVDYPGWVLDLDGEPCLDGVGAETVRIPIRVPAGTQSVIFYVGSGMETLNGFGVDGHAESPSGSQHPFGVPGPDTRVSDEQTYRLMRIDEPETGEWVVELESAPGRNLQRGVLMVGVQKQSMRMYTGVEPDVAEPNKPIRIWLAVEEQSEVSNVETAAVRIRGPGGFDQVHHLAELRPGHYQVTLPGIAALGEYEILSIVESGPAAVAYTGETFGGAVPAPLPIHDFFLSGSAVFAVDNAEP